MIDEDRIELQAVLNRATAQAILELNRAKNAAEADLNAALDVVDQLLKHLDDESRTGAWLDAKCMGDDHQLFDAIMSLPAPVQEGDPMIPLRDRCAMTTRTITRDELRVAVQIACMHLTGMDRDDVLAFAESEPRVAAGAWQLILPSGERCYCPISGVGIDRLKGAAQNFAVAFDERVGASGSKVVLEVVDA